jgi:hypothetical protein
VGKSGDSGEYTSKRIPEIWAHLGQEEALRRVNVLGSLGWKKHLSVIAFSRGEPVEARNLLAEYLGRPLSGFEDPCTLSTVLIADFDLNRVDLGNKAWHQLAANLSLPDSVASEMAHLAGPASPSGYCDQEVCAVLAENPMISEGLAMSMLNFTKEAFHGGDEYEYDTVGESLLRNYGLPPSVLQAVAENRGLELPGANIAIPVEWMEKLVQADLYALPTNVMIPGWVFEQLAQSNDERVLYSLVRNPVAPSNFLSRMATSTNRDVRLGVAENFHTESDDLVPLSIDPDEIVRARVGRHPNTPPQVRAALSQDTEWSVRSHVASCVNTSHEILDSLSRDDFVQVRRSVACNKSTLESALMLLAGDNEESVRTEALRSIEELSQNPVGVDE